MDTAILSRSFLHRTAAAALALTLAGCFADAEPAPDESTTTAELGTCTRNLTVLRGPQSSCSVDLDCPCGSFCDLGEHVCTFKCIPGSTIATEQCATGTTCDP